MAIARIQKRVIHDVDEELGGRTVQRRCSRHGNRACRVAQPRCGGGFQDNGRIHRPRWGCRGANGYPGEPTPLNHKV